MFDPSAVSDVTVTPRDAEVVVAWSSAAPAGTSFQVYQDGGHVCTTRARRCALPRPHVRARYDVGAVGPGESAADFSAALPAPPGGGTRVLLRWPGGSYLSPALAGFLVFQGTAPGGPVDFSAPVGRVALYSQGSPTDGFGLGGFGLGGFGLSESSYSWLSGPLAAGVWNFAVVPVDVYGNLGAGVTASRTVTGPPGPVPRDASGARVRYAFTPGVGGAGPTVTLSWSAAPPP